MKLTSIQNNMMNILAPGGRGWHTVPGEGDFYVSTSSIFPSSVLRTSSPSRGEGNNGLPSAPSPRSVPMRDIGAAPRGFTLIELLVVVLIIGILAAVAVPQYQKTVLRARIMSAVPFVKAVYDAQQLYYLEHGAYADSISKLDIQVACPAHLTCAVGRGLPKAEVASEGIEVIEYYASTKMWGSVEVKGKIYCAAPLSNKFATAVCRSMGPQLGPDANGLVRHLIQ